MFGPADSKYTPPWPQLEWSYYVRSRRFEVHTLTTTWMILLCSVQLIRSTRLLDHNLNDLTMFGRDDSKYTPWPQLEWSYYVRSSWFEVHALTTTRMILLCLVQLIRRTRLLDHNLNDLTMFGPADSKYTPSWPQLEWSYYVRSRWFEVHAFLTTTRMPLLCSVQLIRNTRLLDHNSNALTRFPLVNSFPLFSPLSES